MKSKYQYWTYYLTFCAWTGVFASAAAMVIYRKRSSPHQIKRGWRRSRTDCLSGDISGGWRSRLFGSQWATHAVTIMVMVFVFCVLWEKKSSSLVVTVRQKPVCVQIAYWFLTYVTRRKRLVMRFEKETHIQRREITVGIFLLKNIGTS